MKKESVKRNRLFSPRNLLIGFILIIVLFLIFNYFYRDFSSNISISNDNQLELYSTTGTELGLPGGGNKRLCEGGKEICPECYACVKVGVGSIDNPEGRFTCVPNLRQESCNNGKALCDFGYNCPKCPQDCSKMRCKNGIGVCVNDKEEGGSNEYLHCKCIPNDVYECLNKDDGERCITISGKSSTCYHGECFDCDAEGFHCDPNCEYCDVHIEGGFISTATYSCKKFPPSQLGKCTKIDACGGKNCYDQCPDGFCDDECITCEDKGSGPQCGIKPDETSCSSGAEEPGKCYKGKCVECIPDQKCTNDGKPGICNKDSKCVLTDCIPGDECDNGGSICSPDGTCPDCNNDFLNCDNQCTICVDNKDGNGPHCISKPHPTYCNNGKSVCSPPGDNDFAESICPTCNPSCPPDKFCYNPDGLLAGCYFKSNI